MSALHDLQSLHPPQRPISRRQQTGTKSSDTLLSNRSPKLVVIGSPSSPPQRHPRHHHPAPAIHLWVGLTIEATAKVVVSFSVSTVAVLVLARTIPYYFAQQTKLKEIQTEVHHTQQRVQQLQASFTRYFDPSQMPTLLREQGHRTDPQQRRIVWQDP